MRAVVNAIRPEVVGMTVPFGRTQVRLTRASISATNTHFAAYPAPVGSMWAEYPVRPPSGRWPARHASSCLYCRGVYWLLLDTDINKLNSILEVPLPTDTHV